MNIARSKAFQSLPALLLSLSVLVLMNACGEDATPAANPSPSPAVTSSSGQSTAGSAPLAGIPTPVPTITPPPGLDQRIESAVQKCTADYLDELRGRQVANPAVTRKGPYETIQDSATRRVEYRTTLQSNFIHIDATSGTDLQGKYVREVNLCSLEYDDQTKQFHPHSTIRIEETTRPGN